MYADSNWFDTSTGELAPLTGAPTYANCAADTILGKSLNSLIQGDTICYQGHGVLAAATIVTFGSGGGNDYAALDMQSLAVSASRSAGKQRKLTRHRSVGSILFTVPRCHCRPGLPQHRSGAHPDSGPPPRSQHSSRFGGVLCLSCAGHQPLTTPTVTCVGRPAGHHTAPSRRPGSGRCETCATALNTYAVGKPATVRVIHDLETPTSGSLLAGRAAPIILICMWRGTCSRAPIGRA